ncbi:hypothetical protein DSO57_1025956 [Entomophthora muscae]|uniref:Uncharacterized protein n=1 Tax=Entomophthora muscae TaxID=34485 RepID=A0ACC2SRB6_9FUNG|nr:hypothetical protein DSO57_1025956 [Entomophthora muscae]
MLMIGIPVGYTLVKLNLGALLHSIGERLPNEWIPDTKLLHTVNVLAPVESLKEASPAVGAAMAKFLENFKGLSVHQVSKVAEIREDHQNCTYINLVVNKTHVWAILDTDSPGNIISSRLVKKLKMASDLAYHEEFGTAGPQTTRAKGAFYSLPLFFGKLMVTAPAIVLGNNSYSILIGTSFMVQYGTMTNHGDHTFGTLGHSIPMFYHGNHPSDLPLRCLLYINLEYTDGELPVAYTSHSKKVEVLPLLAEEDKGIPVYASCNVTIPPDS